MFYFVAFYYNTIGHIKIAFACHIPISIRIGHRVYTIVLYTFTKSEINFHDKVIINITIIKCITEHSRFVFSRTTCISITLHTFRHHVPWCILYTTRSTSSIILCPTAHYTFFLIRYVFYFPECNRINSPRHHNYVC